MARSPDQVSGHPVGTIAALLDLSEMRVQQLAKEGVIPKARHGVYDVPACVQGYIRYLRARQITSADGNRPRDSIGVARASWLEAKARMATLEAETAQGKVLDRAEVEQTWSLLVGAFRTRLLSIPSSTAQALAHLHEPAHIEALLNRAIIEALDELSRTQVVVAPDQGADDANGSDAESVAAHGEAAAEADALTMG